MFQLGDAEQHNFHSATDEDWVTFYAPTGFAYELTATQLGDQQRPAAGNYTTKQSDGSVSLVDGVDNHMSGVGEEESLNLDLKTGTSGQLPGVYTRESVRREPESVLGRGSEYEIRIFIPTGGGGGVPFPPVLNPDQLPIGSFCIYLGPPRALAAGAGWRIQQASNEDYF